MRRVSIALFLLAGFGALVAACDVGGDVTPSSGAPSTLAGTAWRAISVSGAAPVQGREPTLAFVDEAQVNGNTGCNSFFGGYTYDEGTIGFTNVGMTLMACDDAVGTVEGAFTKALNGATSAGIDDGGQLLLSGPGGDVLLVPVVD